MPVFSRTWTDQQLIAVVPKCDSWTAVARCLGLSKCKRDAVQRLRKHAARLELDVSYLSKGGPRVAPQRNCAYAPCSKSFKARKQQRYCSRECHRASRADHVLDTWLRTGQPIRADTPGGVVRRYLLKEQEFRCALCGMDNKWRGRELTFIMDHINGDASNSCRGNLRLICPNCDSQLETYKGRNFGNGRHARRERYAAGLSY